MNVLGVYFSIFLYFFVLLNTITALDANNTTIWKKELDNFSHSYYESVESLIVNYELNMPNRLRPKELKKVAIKINSRRGVGLSTPINLIKAVISSLENRGFDRGSILIVDYSNSDLRSLVNIDKNENNEFFYEGCPLVALDTGKYFERDWYYESSLPKLNENKLHYNNLDLIYNSTKNEKLEVRKSYLPIPLLFDVDFWINLAVCIDHPILGIEACLLNASLWNVSNHKRFLVNESIASLAAAEILAIPELRNKMELHFISLEAYQFIGGPNYNSMFCKSLPELYMSTDPVALDLILLNILNDAREENGFNLISSPNKLIDYSAKIGIGVNQIRNIEIKEVE